MKNTVITTNKDNGISTKQANEIIGAAFNEAASKDIFTTYRTGKANNTITRHDKELKNFSAFLTEYKYSNDGMTTPEQWSGITFGIIEGYKRHMLQHGYSVNSTNQTLYIIKAYAALAGKAGYIDFVELAFLFL